MSTPARRVADVVASEIARTGTTWAFGHPGGEVVTLIDALNNAGVRFLLTRHEAEAAFAAAGYAEITGRPGVCVATLGPGATNLVTGVASASLERAPIIALTGMLAESSPAGATHQKLDLQGMFGPITKGSHIINDHDAADVTRSAITTALAERPGPVHLALAADVAARPAAGDPGPTTDAAPTGTSLDPRALAAAKSLLQGCSRPAIVTGLTAARLGVADAVRAAAHTLGAPVALTPKSKGVVPEDDPWFLGVLDMAGDGLIGAALDTADVILAVGHDVVELDRRWSWSAPVIHVDVAPDPDGYYRSAVELVGPIAETLAQLTDAPWASRWTTDEVAGHRRAILDHIRPPDPGRLQPWQVVEAVQARVGFDALVTCDVGAHKILVGQLWRTDRPRSFFMANGLSSMGYSIPTALAACLDDPARRVVAFVGDGGLGMYLGELETLVRAGVRMTIVVFADRSLELIRRAELRRDVTTGSTTFANPDFAAVGRAFGVAATEAGTLAGLEQALDRADRADGVSLIAATIDGADYRF
jgi:acetolactate synthase-1/2/3 large subunit